MQLKWMHKVIVAATSAALFVSPLLLMLSPQRASSTTELMVRLPAYNKNKCLICHTTATPVASSQELNAFGRDFLANGNVWNKALALMNSDQDKCTNGFELGDSDGDGVMDHGGQAMENSNPGNASDCTIALTPGTWGIIKELFRGTSTPLSGQ